MFVVVFYAYDNILYVIRLSCSVA